MVSDFLEFADILPQMFLIIIFRSEDVELLCRASPENEKNQVGLEAAKATRSYENTGETPRESSSESKGESDHAKKKK